MVPINSFYIRPFLDSLFVNILWIACANIAKLPKKQAFCWQILLFEKICVE